jgi:hypothetical protein
MLSILDSLILKGLQTFATQVGRHKRLHALVEAASGIAPGNGTTQGENGRLNVNEAHG